MTHVNDPRVVDHHARLWKWPPAPDTSNVTPRNVFRAGARRAARRREILAAQSGCGRAAMSAASATRRAPVDAGSVRGIGGNSSATMQSCVAADSRNLADTRPRQERRYDAHKDPH